MTTSRAASQAKLGRIDISISCTKYNACHIEIGVLVDKTNKHAQINAQV